MLILCCGATNAWAARDADAPAAACAGLKVATGAAGKGYSKLFADMKAVCGAAVPLCEVTTTGGLDNLNALSTKEADVGIAQVDTWATMRSGDENIANLQGVMALNSNYLHVVTASRGMRVPGAKKWGGLSKEDDQVVVIQRFSELRGRRVALVGSAQLLGRQLDRALNYKMDLVDVDTDKAAFDMVRSGAVAATLSVSGWPSGSLKELKQDSGLTLVPFDATSPNSQLSVRTINYRGLGVYNNNALAMPNVLFTRPFKGDKASDVARLKACLVEKLEELQEGSFEPGWNEIRDTGATFDVPRFAPATSAARPVADGSGAKKKS
jgi:ABC-type amino acid transport substrate-binding protein